MIDLNNLKKKDVVVDSGELYVVTKLAKVDDKDDVLVTLEPFFESDENSTLVSTIPQSSIGKTKIRLPIQKKEIDKIYDKLKRIPKTLEPIDMPAIKSIMSENDVFELVVVLRKIWSEKKRTGDKFSNSQNYLLKKIMTNIAYEIAHVLGQDKDKILKKIENLLKKS